MSAVEYQPKKEAEAVALYEQQDGQLGRNI
jgi:hypothetical protein